MAVFLIFDCMRVWGWFVDFFRFSRRETIGIKVLFCLLIVGLSLPYLQGSLTVEQTSVPEAFREEVDEYLATLSVKHSAESYASLPASRPSPAYNQPRSENPRPAEYFEFNPNTLALEGWIRLGFTERQANMVVNYRDKGGRFYRKEDLQKIYAIDENDYLRIEDYVVIPREERPARSEGSESEVFRPIILELNAADSLQLQLLPGIGPAFASRIVRYRDRMGGFHDVSQLLDVYGMDSVRVKGFVSQVTVDPLLMTGINVNLDDRDKLARHPLVGYKLANILMRYREHNPPFTHTDELKALGIIEDDVWIKLKPYLIF